MKTIWYWHFQRVCDMLLLSIWTASYSLSWLTTPYSLYHRRLFLDILTVSTYTILPSIAGGLVLSIKKGAVYERTLFTAKNKLFRQGHYLDEAKHFYTDLINLLIEDDKGTLHIFCRNGLYLATNKIGKNNPKTEQIKGRNKPPLVCNFFRL